MKYHLIISGYDISEIESFENKADAEERLAELGPSDAHCGVDAVIYGRKMDVVGRQVATKFAIEEKEK